MYTRPPRVDRRIKYVVGIAVVLSLLSLGGKLREEIERE